MTADLYLLTGQLRDYAWGMPGGISRALGLPSTSEPEAELWLGAHPSAPSALADAPWADLEAWQQAGQGPLPFLLKLLAAGAPLSLQAHPTPEQAAIGFAREDAAGIPRDAANRNYTDPFAKPELIVAVENGFEALCGFQPVSAIRAVVDELSAAATNSAPFVQWRSLLDGPDGLRAAFEWLLGPDQAVHELVAEITRIANEHPQRWALAALLAQQYHGDPGIAIALMLNHVTLQRGEALWLPAGNIHAYLSGTGVELMGPSDNVLRGGLTPKHIDVPELIQVLDFQPVESPQLPVIQVSANTVSYRPASQASGTDVPFELLLVTGDDSVQLAGPAIALVTEGEFVLELPGRELTARRGDSVFVTEATALEVRGQGSLYFAV